MTEINPYQVPQSTVHVPDQGYGEIRILSTSGRMGRLRYIAYSFFVSIVVALFSLLLGLLIDGSIGAASRPGSIFSIINIILSILMLIVMAAWTIQRLHDFNAKGAWALLLLVPAVNLIFMIVLMIRRGDDQENRFGKTPPPNTLGVKILAFLSLVLMLLILISFAFIMVFFSI